MSYFSQSKNTALAADKAYALTPMLADILAIEALNGLHASRLGDTVYRAGTAGLPPHL